MSLSGVLDKTWSPRGVTPLQKTTANRGSISMMSVFNSSSLIFMLHQGKIKSSEIIKFFKKILKHESKRHIVLIMDKAPPHTSRKTLEYINSEKRLHIFNFPSRSPEFNPHEKICNYLKNEELKVIIKNKLIKMSKRPNLLKGLFYRSILSKFFK